MIFLKRIEAYGFKSFGEPISISFEHGMVGVVGPNGSGKSNINDAIRWALGEQSIKSLRGNSSEDIIFSGAENKQSLNMSEVKLIFDNSDRILDLEYDEVEVVRRLFRGSGENEYYINKQRVRLKDVQDLAADTGLTRSSLAIISQGNVSNFAESKPIDRRLLFEEAAGVSKYKKRKLESMRKLERTNENLSRLQDLITEMERKLPVLRRQREKALKYKTKKDQLNEIEVAVLVKDISFFNDKLVRIEAERKSLEIEKNNTKQEISDRETEFNNLNNSNYQLDHRINELSKNFEVIVNEISQLKVQKIELDNKKRFSTTDQAQSIAQRLSEKFNGLCQQQLIQEKKLEITNEDLKTAKKDVEFLFIQRDKLEQDINNQNREIIKCETEIERIEQALENRSDLFEGVHTILKNSEVLPGVFGIVQDLITFDKKYEIALSTALGNHLQDIIIDTAENAKKCISFLKQNRAGQATFLPLKSISARYLSEEEIYVAKSIPGYLGVANELITIDINYQLATDYLLARYLICETYESALKVSEITRQRYNVINLEGDIIRPQGAITGGSQKRRNLFNHYEEQLINLKSKLEISNNELMQLRNLITNVKSELIKAEAIQNNCQSFVGTLTMQISNLKLELESVNDEYCALTGRELNKSNQNVSPDKAIDFLIKKLTNYEMDKNKIEQDLTSARHIREKQSEKINELNSCIQEKRYFLNAINEKMGKLNTDIAMAKEKINQDLNRLSEEYRMTYEYAVSLQMKPIENENLVREQIKQLRSDLAEMGAVNLDSIEEYESENQRYEFMNKQCQEIRNSSNTLLKAIQEMDEIMKTRFDNMIKDVNLVLPETFKVLFGGGSAQIEYSEPDNLLETGIDVRVSPPGKMITNLNLLSGGEKSLVALSVLFAVLKVRPLPLVILDEVEAPLDVANVERFAKYIKDFTNTTQFIVVTHRLGTMEYCDVLYGATMQQKGVTKIVGIKLLDAQKIVEQIEKTENNATIN